MTALFKLFLKMRWVYSSIAIVGLQLFFACNHRKISSEPNQECKDSNQVKYAKGFCLDHQENYTIIKLLDPSTGSPKKQWTLIPKGDPTPNDTPKEDIIEIPVTAIVPTSTTHIPPIELLEQEATIVGFPSLDYISSTRTRARIDSGLVRELGQNEALNTEVLITLKPEVLMTFSIDGQQKGLNKIKQGGIPVIYNGDWTEQHPLGKAEWIKVFGALFDKQALADSIFQEIEHNYQQLQLRAKQATSKPKVISGALYKDIWYAPKGDSWAAQFLKDAHAEYLWSNTSGTGSLQWNIEKILQYSQQAQVWIGPGQFTSYSQMTERSATYTQFKPFVNKRIFTFSKTKGPTGGLLYYEMASMRPDWVLSDLIYILHPGQILKDYEPKFFTSLDP